MPNYDYKTVELTNISDISEKLYATVNIKVVKATHCIHNKEIKLFHFIVKNIDYFCKKHIKMAKYSINQEISFVNNPNIKGKITFIHKPFGGHQYYDVLTDSSTKKNGVQEYDIEPIIFYNIDGFEFISYLNLENIKIENLPSSQWIFVTGKNAEGKTALLQAITMCCINNKYIPYNLKPQFLLKVFASRKGSKIIYQYPTTNRNSVIAYGVSRLKMQAEYDKANFVESNPAYSLLYQEDGNLQNICEWFKDKFMESKLVWTDEMNLVKDLLIKCTPSVKNVQIVGSTVKFQTEDNEVEFHQLAAGNKSIIAMLGDMVIRLLKVNHEAKQLSDLKGIVLIDEIEAHLHPIWQKKIVRLLTELLPNVQFIATTHSPIPLLGAPKDSIVLKLQRNEKQQIEIVRVDKDPDFWKLLPNALLSSKIFDMEEILPEGKSEFSTLDDANEVAFNEQVRKRLENFLSNDNL